MWIHLVPLELIDGATSASEIPVQTRIINKIESLINLMTTTNGYAISYGSINEYDPDSRSYPAVFFDVISEEGFNATDETIVDRYTVQAPFVFEVMISTVSNIHQQLDYVISDFGKMFASNIDSLQSEGMIWYEYRDYNIEYTNIKAYPAKLTHTWDIQYRRQKTSPYLT